MPEQASIRAANADSTSDWPLLASFKVGRGRGCHLVLDDPRVSAEHAVFTHIGGGDWLVRDLGSKNGTYVDGRRLPHGDFPVRNGETVAFGDPRLEWRFAAGAPCDVLVVGPPGTPCLSAVAADRVLALPTADVAEATLLLGAEGWVLEGPSAGTFVVVDGQILHIAGHPYRVWFSGATEPTEDASAGRRRLGDAVLRLGVSQDEEQIHAELHAGTIRIPLPSRAYLYMLVVLGRHRCADATFGVSRTEAGWRYADEIARALGVEQQALNVLVHRARQDLAKLGFEDPASLIERRSMTRQLRIGIAEDRIVLTRL